MLNLIKDIRSQLHALGKRERTIILFIVVGFFVVAAGLLSRYEVDQKIENIKNKIEAIPIITKILEEKPIEASKAPASYIELPDGTKIPIQPVASPSRYALHGVSISPYTAPPLSRVNRGEDGNRRLALPLKIYRDDFLGFSIRIPEQWHINSTQGRILIKREPRALTGAIIYPVLLEKNMTPLQFLKTCFGIYQKIYAAHDGTLQLGAITETGNQAKGPFSGSLEGTNIQGEVIAQIEGRKANYRSYWAPSEDWQNLYETLQVIASSFESFQSKPLELYQGKVFQIYYPLGWQVSETLNGIDVVDPVDKTAVTIGLLVYNQGNPNPMQLMDFNLQKMRIQNGIILKEKDYADVKDGMGQSWNIYGREMEYDWQGMRYRAVLTSGVLKQYLSFSGIVMIRQAALQRWDEASPLLEAIEKSFKVIHGEVLGGGIKSIVLPTNHPADTSSIMEQWKTTNTSSDQAEGSWSEYIRGGGYRKSEKTGEDVWVTPQDFDAGQGGYINPNDPSDVIPES